jgi:hypothetical protein
VKNLCHGGGVFPFCLQLERHVGDRAEENMGLGI